MDCSALACYSKRAEARVGVSDDNEHSESDGLDALASGLPATESEDADEDLDLASLAAVAATRASGLASGPEAELGASDTPEKLVLAAPVGMSAAPATGLPPAAAPAGRPERGWLVPVLVACALGVGVGGYLLGRSSRPEPSAAVAVAAPAPEPAVRVPAPTLVAKPPAPATESPETPTVAPAASASVQPPSSPVAEGPTPAAATSPRPAAIAPSAARRGAVQPGSVAPEEQPVNAPAAVEPQPSPAKPTEPATLAKTEPSASRSVDQLLDEALSGTRSSRGADPSAASTALPEAPTREEVTQAMAVLLPAIRGCAMGQTGLATAGIVVRGDGRVASVELTGAPFEGTASGRCMEGVLRRARFSRFKQPTFRVRFPFSIQ